MTVELAARTVGSLVIRGDDALVAKLSSRATAINPSIDLDASATRHPVAVGIQVGHECAVNVQSAGWWAGLGTYHAAGAAEGRNPLGSALAGVLAFTEFFKLAYEPVLATLGPMRASGPGWSLRDWRQREIEDVDLEDLPILAHAPTAIIGCGAIGHAAAFVLGQLPLSRGALELVDPQTISQSNLQRYLGTTPEDAQDNSQKVKTLARLLTPAYAEPVLRVYDWSGYRRRGFDSEVLLSALDSASDRRMLQASLPRLIINGWTRLAECGLTTHWFAGNEQCLQCTYLPQSPGAVRNDLNQIISELGLDPVRVVHLLAGASLSSPDLRGIERHRGLADRSLERWRGESVRPLFGHLCGMAEVRQGVNERYVVPLPHTSALAGLLVAAQFVQYAASLRLETRPLELSLIRGPGDAWQSAPALKDSHPVVCICKDPIYLAGYKDRWPS
jgi:hypothetical protein